MAAWRNGIASDYDSESNQEIAGSSPAVVNTLRISIFDVFCFSTWYKIQNTNAQFS